MNDSMKYKEILYEIEEEHDNQIIDSPKNWLYQ